ncbi:hypothetical protein WJX84_005644 [Apatococcus fuscideae]|uniref:Uncharacterized protein n=1 Tax=Apatococcus fuscideae TaxID=2026836 RepID=A0AAW1T819_9CHLO
MYCVYCSLRRTPAGCPKVARTLHLAELACSAAQIVDLVQFARLAMQSTLQAPLIRQPLRRLVDLSFGHSSHPAAGLCQSRYVHMGFLMDDFKPVALGTEPSACHLKQLVLA